MAASNDAFSGFKFYSLKEERPKGKGKVTVARYKEENLALEFIPRPHTCYLGNIMEIAGEDDEEVVTLFYTGGYSARDENVVTDGFKCITAVSVIIGRGDIKVNGVRSMGRMPSSLTFAGGVLMQNDGDLNFYIFGGLDPEQRSCNNDLLVCKLQSEDKLVVSKSSRDVSDVWPSERFGHSFNQLNDNILMLVGGNNMPNRHSNLPDASNIFHTEPVADVLYVYWKEENFWQHITTESELSCKRAFHATCRFVINGIDFLIVSGGLTYDNCWRSLPMSKTFIVKVDESNQVQIKEKMLHLSAEIYISDHSILFNRNKILFVGGVVSSNESSVPQLNTSVEVFNYLNGQHIQQINVGQEYCTSACSSVILPDNSVIVPGGNQRRISVFTYKTMNADKCFHWDKHFVTDCIISQSCEVTPAWIQCDMCSTWMHLFA